MRIFKMAAVSHVVFAFEVMADHPRSAFRGLNSVLKWLIRRINSSGDIAMYRFWRFCFKIHAHFWEVFEAYFPYMTSLIIQTLKRTVLGRKHVVWAIQRKNQCDGSTWARAREKIQDNKSHNVLYSVWGKPPLNRFDARVAWWVIFTT